MININFSRFAKISNLQNTKSYFVDFLDKGTKRFTRAGSRLKDQLKDPVVSVFIVSAVVVS